MGRIFATPFLPQIIASHKGSVLRSIACSLLLLLLLLLLFLPFFCRRGRNEAGVHSYASEDSGSGGGNERFCPAAGETAGHRKYEERVRFRHPRNTGTTENGLKLARPLFNAWLASSGRGMLMKRLSLCCSPGN